MAPSRLVAAIGKVTNAARQCLMDKRSAEGDAGAGRERLDLGLSFVSFRSKNATS
jgi:hypothetical protein